jgi:putative NIF3 family GTP cyclohydrolase 1 type 2
MKLNDITKTLEQIAPLELAEEWDNVGQMAAAMGDNVSNLFDASIKHAIETGSGSSST